MVQVIQNAGKWKTEVVNEMTGELIAEMDGHDNLDKAWEIARKNGVSKTTAWKTQN